MKDDIILAKVYVTKYALTKGIQIFENVRQCVSVSVDMIATADKHSQCFHKGDWYTNPNAAIKKAEEICSKKIESLKKQISKLEKMEFKI